MSTKQKRRVHGAYDRNGYTIYLNGRPYYTAGNHPGDSTAYLDPKSDRHLIAPLDLRTLRQYCRKTAKQIAAEQKAEYQGIYRHDGTDGER
jgi:hypothetical protein